MVISYKNKYIFIAAPKTGSRSVRKFLLFKDKTAINYSDLKKTKGIDIPGHATAQQIKKILSDKLFYEFKKIVIVRHPYAKIVSSYFFYKNGYALTKGNTDPLPTLIRVWSAKILPFKLWALVYPYKSNFEYLTDEKGEIIVDYIGRQEQLSSDIIHIFNELGFDWNANDFPHENKSSSKKYDVFFQKPWFKRKIDQKIKEDLLFYERLANNINTKAK